MRIHLAATAVIAVAALLMSALATVWHSAPALSSVQLAGETSGRLLVSAGSGGGDGMSAAAVADVAATAGTSVVESFVVGDRRFDVVAGGSAEARDSAARSLRAAGLQVSDETHFTADRTPGDPLWDADWGRVLGSPQVWAAGTGAGTLVAVLDTGVSPTVDLPASRIRAGRSFVDGEQSWEDLAEHRHGTRTAETLAGTANNGVASAGGCWDCEVLPVRVLDREGRGTSASVAQGIVWAVEQGAQVVNLSLSGARPDDATRSASAWAQQQGVLVVASAGNHSTAVPHYPASYPEVLGVSGLDTPERRHPASAFGQAGSQISAPFCVMNSLGRYCGTSASAPVVSGHAASLISAGYRADQVGAALVGTAVELDTPVALGGRMDAAAALAGLVAGRFPGGTPPLCEDAPEVAVVQGADRFETAALLADRRMSDSGTPSTVVIAAGRPYIDAVASGPAFGDDAVVLLTGKDALPSATVERLRRIAPDRIVVVGGPSVVAPAVLTELGGYAGKVERVSGADRYETAYRLWEQQPGPVLHVASGRMMPQALTAASWAAASGEGLMLACDTRCNNSRLGSWAHVALRVEQTTFGVAHNPYVASALRNGRTFGELSDFATFRADDPEVFPMPGRRLLITTAEGAVDAVAGAALAAASGDPVFVPSQPWALGGLAEAAEVVAAHRPDEVWLVGRAGDLDPRPLLCQ